MIDTRQAHVLLARLDPDAERSFGSGVLCLRHADAMAVPRGWSMDDRREPTPRLFATRPLIDPAGPATVTTAPSQRRNRHRRGGAGIIVPTLPFDRQDLASLVGPAVEPPAAPAVNERSERTQVQPSRAAALAEPVATDDPDATSVLAWRPDFATAEDIDDLRTARSPLLSRAFRGLRPHE